MASKETKTNREFVLEVAQRVCGKPPRTVTPSDLQQILAATSRRGISRDGVNEYLRDAGYTRPPSVRKNPKVRKLIEKAFKDVQSLEGHEEIAALKAKLLADIAAALEPDGLEPPTWSHLTEIARDFGLPGWPNMGQKSKHDGKLQKAAQAWREFVKVYNDHRTCPLMHDLLRVLFPGDETKDKRRLLNRKVEAYRAFREEHPEFNLPELMLRKGKDGSLIGLPEGVVEQLAEFRIDVKKASRAKGLLVTSAQYGAVLNTQVFEALKRYADHLGYTLVVLPIKYGPIKTVYQKELDRRVLLSTFDEGLKGYMLFEDLSFAGGMLTLNVIRLRPTLQTFLTDPICERGGNASQIFAAPKLELAFRPRLRHDYPKAIMTTGAVTHPSYNVDNLGQQDRTGELARAEHTYSAIIVEFSSEKTFHFRQLLATTKGEFYDIDPLHGGAVKVTPKGIERRPDDVVAAVLGDWHVGKTHPDVRRLTFEEMLPAMKPKHVVLHDLFDGNSISHWEERQASRRAYKGARQDDSIERELEAMVEELKWMRERMPGAKLHVVASNHNEFLRQCIEELRWSKDNANLAIGAKIFDAIQEDMKARGLKAYELAPMDPVNWWIDNQRLPDVVTHSRRSKLILPEAQDAKKILCSLHGDIGSRGQKAGAMTAFRKWNHWIIIGHAHDAAILGPIWRVGTSSHLTDHYVNGPATNWTHTHALIYANGQRQLINIMNGAWHGQRKRRPKSAGLEPEGAKLRPPKAEKKGGEPKPAARTQTP
jgi:hypothetical protein